MSVGLLLLLVLQKKSNYTTAVFWIKVRCQDLLNCTGCRHHSQHCPVVMCKSQVQGCYLCSLGLQVISGNAGIVNPLLIKN